MTYQDSGYPIPPNYAPPKRSNAPVFIILGIVVLLVVLAVLGGIVAFRAAQKSSAAAIVVGDRFLDDVRLHKFQAADDLFTSDVKASTPASNLKDLEFLVEKHHGAFIDHGVPGWFAKTYNGQNSMELYYPARFAKSSDTISMILVATPNGYRVYGCNYAQL